MYIYYEISSSCWCCFPCPYLVLMMHPMKLPIVNGCEGQLPCGNVQMNPDSICLRFLQEILTVTAKVQQLSGHQSCSLPPFVVQAFLMGKVLTSTIML